jgi:hypothetical protein
MTMIFGREPAQWVGLISGGLMLLVGLGLALSQGQVDAIQAFVSALAAVVVASATRPLQVSVFQQFVKAAIAMVVIFGIDINVALQTAMLAFVETVFNFAMRANVSPVERSRT